ncbi:tetratricopeptide repeat protein [Roseospira goensis]|uniref:protein O-GlcNAc transferase n=1 Tax=Roseospira goensis TaxID=391922 RepID=A0A7W6WJV7_9PROT|nr:tetratricopeptide repeat protein [Roseospira goensis]MBB4284893.1 putative O-linked N-acetylglucosamine transferase (SPINDLY family) [Roseospira goensis]
MPERDFEDQKSATSLDSVVSLPEGGGFLQKLASSAPVGSALFLAEQLDALHQIGAHLAVVPKAETFTRRFPHYEFGWIALCVALRQLKRLDAALETTGLFIAWHPTAPAAYQARARVLVDLGRADEVARQYQRRASLQPDDVTTLAVYGDLLRASNRLDEAAAVYARALALDPLHNDCLLGRADVLGKTGDLSGMLALYRRALAANPANAHVFRWLARSVNDLGKTAQAEFLCQRSIHLRPDWAEPLVDLGDYRRKGRPDRGAELYRKALVLDPASHRALLNLSSTHMELGETETALRVLSRVERLKPHSSVPQSNKLFYMHYLAEATQAEIRAVIDAWARTFADRTEAPPPTVRDPRPDRPLRIGMISSGFGRHPALKLSLPAFEAMDRDTYRLIAYSGRRREDDLTKRLAACAEIKVVEHLYDAALSALIRDDEIDILIDMAGHASGCRLAIFPQRLAPVQVKWVGGQFNTTGVPGMDWFIADAVEVPPGHEVWYTERVYRMPDGYVVFEPPATAPPIWPLPARIKDHVTFGSFNNPIKVNARTIDLWTRVLNGVPDSRLILKGDKFAVPAAQRHLLALFARGGIGAERIIFRGHTPHTEHLQTYNEVDISLDPWPYSGGLTTCESLWMGVPVVSWPGPTFAGRHAASHLNNVGLTEWIAADADAYVDIAVSWAHRLDDLAALRASLRETVSASTLCDGPRFARHLETALRHMWHDALTRSRVAQPCEIGS